MNIYDEIEKLRYSNEPKKEALFSYIENVRVELIRQLGKESTQVINSLLAPPGFVEKKRKGARAKVNGKDMRYDEDNKKWKKEGD